MEPQPPSPLPESFTASATATAGTLSLGAFVIFLGIALGAFGAHGLQRYATPAALATFQTGVTYQIYHGLALFGLGILEFLLGQGPGQGHGQDQDQTIPGLGKVKLFFLLGILFFSVNCYLYVLTQVKFFALLVPVGGVCFLVGWGLLAWSGRKWKRGLWKKIPGEKTP